MTLEEYNEKDFEALYVLLRDRFAIPVTKEICKSRLSELINQNYQVYVAKSDIELLGCCVIYIHLDPFDVQPFATLWYFAVSKSAQGKGVGKFILQEVSNKLQKKGISSIRLTTAQQNFACQKASESAGFNKCFAYKKKLNE